MAFDLNAANIALLKGMISTARPMEEMLSVKGKVAVVTGATSGLGFNIALRLLQGGANVVIAGSSAAKGDYTLPLLAEAGFGPDRVVFCKTNVCEEADMEKLIRTADETFGSLDIFVNSAAVWSYAHIYDLFQCRMASLSRIRRLSSLCMLEGRCEFSCDRGSQGAEAFRHYGKCGCTRRHGYRRIFHEYVCKGSG